MQHPYAILRTLLKRRRLRCPPILGRQVAAIELQRPAEHLVGRRTSRRRVNSVSGDSSGVPKSEPDGLAPAVGACIFTKHKTSISNIMCRRRLAAQNRPQPAAKVVKFRAVFNTRRGSAIAGLSVRAASQGGANHCDLWPDATAVPHRRYCRRAHDATLLAAKAR